jgi:hypothetical protein
MVDILSPKYLRVKKRGVGRSKRARNAAATYRKQTQMTCGFHVTAHTSDTILSTAFHIQDDLKIQCSYRVKKKKVK